MSENPYEPPSAASVGRYVNPATLLWSAVAVFGCAGVGGVLGLGIGAALGAFVPDWDRSVFRGGADAHFDPIAVGIGQGLTQGVVFGGITGLVLSASAMRSPPGQIGDYAMVQNKMNDTGRFSHISLRRYTYRTLCFAVFVLLPVGCDHVRFVRQTIRLKVSSNTDRTLDGGSAAIRQIVTMTATDMERERFDPASLRAIVSVDSAHFSE